MNTNEPITMDIQDELNRLREDMHERPEPAKIPESVRIPRKLLCHILTCELRTKGYIPATHQVERAYLHGYDGPLEVTIEVVPVMPSVELVFPEPAKPTEE